MQKQILLTSKNGNIKYEDSEDHFRNGVLRLLKMDESQFCQWLEYTAKSHETNPVYRLRNGYELLHPHTGERGPFEKETNAIEEGPLSLKGKYLYPWLAENPQYGVAIDESKKLGWLVRKPSSNHFVREAEPPVYEEEYFEGDLTKAGGYGNYIAQQGWRLEKSQRQVKEIQEITGLSSGQVLDIGSGYGFFRKALDQAGFSHDGLEISKHACHMAKELYHFDSFQGTLEDFVKQSNKKYHLITLWDVIEHVTSPSKFLKLTATCLYEGGYVALKTPNLNCPEQEIFGPYYHSFKREHLFYFTAASLEELMNSAGFKRKHMSSVSHLLLGFFGKDTTTKWEADLLGADLFCIFQKQ